MGLQIANLRPGHIETCLICITVVKVFIYLDSRVSVMSSTFISIYYLGEIILCTPDDPSEWITHTGLP